jgi:hypothetical protein
MYTPTAARARTGHPDHGPCAAPNAIVAVTTATARVHNANGVVRTPLAGDPVRGGRLTRIFSHQNSMGHVFEARCTFVRGTPRLFGVLFPTARNQVSVYPREQSMLIKRTQYQPTDNLSLREQRAGGERGPKALLRSASMLIAALLVATGVLASTSVVNTAGAQAASGYSAIGSGLALRAGPNTGSAILARYAAHQALAIACQTSGQNVQGSSVWDQISGTTGYVADFYVNGTPYAQFDNRIPRCEGSPAPAGRTILGGVELRDACVWMNGEAQAVNQAPHTAYTWRCLYKNNLHPFVGMNPNPYGAPARVDNWQIASIDMNAACSFTYFDPNARAALRDTSPSGWF